MKLTDVVSECNVFFIIQMFVPQVLEVYGWRAGGFLLSYLTTNDIPIHFYSVIKFVALPAKLTNGKRFINMHDTDSIDKR